MLTIGAIAILLSIAYAAVASCMNQAPAGAGACDEDYDCASANTPKACESSAFSHWQIKEDFPLTCVDSQGNNCNQPLANCKTRVSCIWKDSECHEDQVIGSEWTRKRKRTLKACE
jgi:hypothetical protein